MVKHARCYWLLLSQGHLTQGLFEAMARRVAPLPLPAGSARRKPEQISSTSEVGKEKCRRNRSGKRQFRAFGLS